MNLKLSDPVPAHLDIFGLQVQNERDFSTPNVEFENVVEPHEDGKLDWREALSKLNREDLVYVDNRAKYVGALTDDVDAMLEDELYEIGRAHV